MTCCAWASAPALATTSVPIRGSLIICCMICGKDSLLAKPVTSAGLAAHAKPLRNRLPGSTVWHANVFNVHSRRNRDSRLTTTRETDVLPALLGACNETRLRARCQSALFRGSLGRRNRRAGGHHQTREAGSADVAVPCRTPRRRAPSGHPSNDRSAEPAGDLPRPLSTLH